MSHPQVTCERCGAEADVAWLEVTRMGDPGPTYLMGHSTCTTWGCVNEYGRTWVLPPDHPDRRLTPEDHAWKRRHYELAAEYTRATRLLMEVQ